MLQVISITYPAPFRANKEYFAILLEDIRCPCRTNSLGFSFYSKTLEAICPQCSTAHLAHKIHQSRGAAMRQSKTAAIAVAKERLLIAPWGPTAIAHKQ